jgi:hypothetical protein
MRENCIFYDDWDEIFFLEDEYRGSRVRTVHGLPNSIHRLAPADIPVRAGTKGRDT